MTDIQFPSSYGDNCAEFYDEIYPSVDRKMIDVLVALARNGRALDLGIGTGRVALPLRARGIDVSGVEISRAMLEEFRKKPFAANVPVVVGNFADCEVNGTFNLVFALVNTFYLLESPDEQQKSFRNVARMLSPTGVLVLENYEFGGGRSGRQTSSHSFRQEIATSKGIREYRSEMCYASPAYLDEMARVAGLKLRDRWSNWSGTPYVTGDAMYISIYEKSVNEE